MQGERGGELQGGRSASLRSAPPCSEVEKEKKSQKGETLNICKDKKRLKHARQLRKRQEITRVHKDPYRQEQESILMGALPPTANPHVSFFSVGKINRSFFIYFCFILFIFVKNRLTVVNITITIVHIP